MVSCIGFRLWFEVWLYEVQWLRFIELSHSCHIIADHVPYLILFCLKAELRRLDGKDLPVLSRLYFGVATQTCLHV